ncbi:MAG TPA: FHA domain-containing protein, partial [Mariprofundaceae bacterium]|nr:FHA domain-containing protein [Mariprofundaceae bacterium]
MSKLIVRSASGEHVYTIDGDVGIGRHPKCAICLHDPMISKRHAMVRQVGEDFVFDDMDSSNGSFIDGVRVRSHKLKDGDQITMGKVTITFQAATEAEKLSQRVNISNISHISQVQDRIQVSSMEKFMPEG